MKIKEYYVGPLAFALSVLALAGCDEKTQPDTAAISLIPALTPMAIPLCLNNQCGVLDQDGAILISPDSNYNQMASLPSSSKTFIFAKDGFWNLANAYSKKVIRENFSDSYVTPLTTGYYAVGQGEKFLVMDEQGKEVQPAKFDNLYVTRETKTKIIVYDVGAKIGFLSATGQLITEPLFDSVNLWGTAVAETGGWVVAQSGAEKWIFNVNTHELKKVEFDKITKFGDEHMVVKFDEGGFALADAHGQLLTEHKYYSLGMPSNGLVAFQQESGCGYLDFQGNVVLPATFWFCNDFGEKGAMVMTKANGSERAKGGFIDRTGKWLIPPRYDWVDRAGYSVLGMYGNVPGYNSISTQTNTGLTTGIFDVNKGVEVFEPVYPQIGVLNDNLFVFTRTNAPVKKTSMFGQVTQTPSMGVMNAAGKVLIEPGEYVDINLDVTGHYLIAMENTTAQSGFALYNLAGKLLVPAKWQELVIDEPRGAVFAYERIDPDTPGTLKALFRLDGTPSFQVSRIECGAEQVRDSKGQVLWPTNPEEFCTQAEPSTDANMVEQ